MPEKKLLKDSINKGAIKRIANALDHGSQSIGYHFEAKSFHQDCLHQLGSLELKQRIQHIINALARHLPQDFTQTALILLTIKKQWNHQHPEEALTGFSAWPIIDYVGAHGLNHPELSLNVLEQMTSLFSAEFAIQPFIIHHPDITYRYLSNWCQHEDEHVRRLVSEGTRPRLPWGLRMQQLCQDPSPVLPLLENLKCDKSEYVRRSVANNLNDISKDHPELVINTCKLWQNTHQQETSWIIKHATRSLVKAGHPDVFPLLGYTCKPSCSVKTLKHQKQVTLGDNFHFSFKLKSDADKTQNLIIDYAIHHTKANGKTTAKVFKLKNLSLPAGKTLNFSKKHPFKKITTRKYYPGKHSIEILVNGTPVKKADFFLKL